MENFKVNIYEKQEQNGFEEFETLSLEYLNQENRFSQEQKAEIEATREKTANENREALNDIYEKIEISDRENSSFFDGRNREVESSMVYFEDYGASFETFDNRNNFVARNNNRNRTESELSKEIDDIKKQVRSVSFGQKMSNFSQAIGFRKSA